MSINCVACRRDIDDAAKLCPYCGADPRSGNKIDTQAILEEVFKPKTPTRAASLIDYARHRQGSVVAIAVFAGFLILAALYQYAVHRNAAAVATGSGVPITEVTDVTDQGEENKPQPLPPMEFQYDGRPQAMRTYIVEPNAPPPPAQPVPPPPPGPAAR